MPHYANLLRALIKTAGYNFRAVHRETGIPESTLYDWAAGNRVIPHQDRIVLARILGCTAEEFAPTTPVQLVQLPQERTDKWQGYEGRRREAPLDRKYKTETARVAFQKKRAEELGLPATLTLEQWLETLEYFGWKCAYCRGKYAVIEHFIPLVHGGGTTASNCVPACYKCNRGKGTYHPQALPADAQNNVQRYVSMNTVKIYRLTHLSPALFGRLKAAQIEAAQVWNRCCELHRQARTTHTTWPGQNELQQATKGRFALHSQSVQMVVHAFLANIETTRKLRATHPKMRMKYPWKTKRFYPVHWPAQAVSRERGRVVLPMGRGRASIVLPLDLPAESGACTLVWNNGFELHVCSEAPQAEHAPGTNRATLDLGEIHLAAVTTDTGAALVVSGRGIRSLKRQRNMRHRQFAKKQARCQKYSRRWRKLQRAKNKMAVRLERRVRDLRHKATRQVINFCVEQQVGTLFIGNPHGVRSRDSGRHHNQRMAQWEYGKDIDYLTHKSEQAHIMSFTGSERGTSSRCPVCRHRHKPRGRVWKCRKCGFAGHRDVVGSINMHKDTYGQQVTFPRSVTYLRPGPARRSSRAGTPHAS